MVDVFPHGMLSNQVGNCYYLTWLDLGVAESALMLIDTVVGAAHAKLRNKRVRPDPVRTADVVAPKRRYTQSGGGLEKIVVLGASTGGPEIIGWILQQLTPECPGLVIVQHMPETFTGTYARRLNTTCRIEVKEAEEGDRATRGRALIAPGNHHLGPIATTTATMRPLL